VDDHPRAVDVLDPQPGDLGEPQAPVFRFWPAAVQFGQSIPPIPPGLVQLIPRGLVQSIPLIRPIVDQETGWVLAVVARRDQFMGWLLMEDQGVQAAVLLQDQLSCRLQAFSGDGSW
jgi:hypothetical protein